MFANLSERLQNALGKLRGKGKLTEADVDTAMREIRLALLEADVNYKVVKDFVKNLKERAIGADVMKSLTPGQMVVNIVNEELIKLMDDEDKRLKFAKKGPTVIMMCGLQGAGKTTHTAKLGKFLRAKGKRPLLIAADIYRPAAIKQLQVVGASAGCPVFTMGTDEDPVNIVEQGIQKAIDDARDVVIIDTAGRLQFDEELMQELERIRDAVEVHETLLVIDSMTGQEAVTVAKVFNERLELTGLILSKLDGDARGGAALSVKAVTGKPIKFIGKGEKLDDLDEFQPDRIVSRILGMGDILTLIDKAKSAFDEEESKKLEKKLSENNFDLNDFYSQLQQIKKMGPLNQLLGMIPGVNQQMLSQVKTDGKEMVHIEAIITSMTPYERSHPEEITPSRRARIAKGSGRSPAEVNKLLKQFKEMKKMIQKMGIFSKNGKKKRMPFGKFFSNNGGKSWQ